MAGIGVDYNSLLVLVLLCYYTQRCMTSHITHSLDFLSPKKLLCVSNHMYVRQHSEYNSIKFVMRYFNPASFQCVKLVTVSQTVLRFKGNSETEVCKS